MELRGAAPSQTHLCYLQCPSTGCSMSTWCLQAATLRWRCGGRSTRRRRCTLTSWALCRSGCARATASGRSTSQKVTAFRETQLALFSAAQRKAHVVVLWRKEPFSPNSVFISWCRAAQYCAVMHLPDSPSVVVPGEGQPVMLCILQMIPHSCRETSDKAEVCQDLSGFHVYLSFFLSLSNSLLDAL